MKKEDALKRLKTLLSEIERAQETAAVFGKASNDLFESKGKDFAALEAACDEAMAEFNRAEADLSADLIVDDELKNKEAVTALIGYFEEGRAASIKDAVSLYKKEQA